MSAPAESRPSAQPVIDRGGRGGHRVALAPSPAISPGTDYLFVLPDGSQALFTKLEDGAQLRLRTSLNKWEPTPTWSAPTWAPDPEPKTEICESCEQVPAAIRLEGFLVCGGCALERGPLL